MCVEIDFETLSELIRESIGVCTSCGAETDGMVEPDARQYVCDSCGEPAVYGAEELLFMGYGHE